MITLLKHNKKTTEIVILEQEDSLIRKKEGKLGKPISFSSTSNCGSFENASQEIKKLVAHYCEKGFIIDESNASTNEFEVFDKAKWHIENNFPKELSSYQAYIHTGFYVGWLIKKELISEELVYQNKKAIQDVLDNKITPVKFFHDCLDGVFTSNDVNDSGYIFTKHYFDFEKGNYLKDYERTLAENLPSLFHVEDNKSNFDDIFKVIDFNYDKWLKSKLSV